MKLVTFVVADGAEHIGALLDDGLTVSDFTASHQASCFASMLALIDGHVGVLAFHRAKPNLSALLKLVGAPSGIGQFPLGAAKVIKM